MTVAAIIAEYNPFHNGHAYHIARAREITSADACVVIMSGDFTQRGEPAVYDKYVRTEAALYGGADLVIELPVFFESASAAYFARGAVDIINAAGIADYLVFGAEDADIDILRGIAETLSEHDTLIMEETRRHAQHGMSFPRARSAALAAFGVCTEIIRKPNNILGIEYLRALYETNSPALPFAVRRIGSAYNDAEMTGKLSSALALRRRIHADAFVDIKDAVPDYAYELYKNETPHNIDKMSQLFQYTVQTKGADYIKQIDGVVEGLEQRIVKSADCYYAIRDIITDIKTKRYTFTKIQRIIIKTILGITREQFELARNKGPAYIRVLGFKKQSGLLPLLIKKSGVPAVTNLKNADKILSGEAYALLKKNIEASDIYNLTCGRVAAKKNDYHRHMVII